MAEDDHGGVDSEPEWLGRFIRTMMAGRQYMHHRHLLVQLSGSRGIEKPETTPLVIAFYCSSSFQAGPLLQRFLQSP